MMSVESIPENRDERKSDQKIYISDITKVSNDFMWQPKINIENGLEDVLRWINSDSLEWVEK